MPMNKFLFDHQLAAMKIDRSGSAEEREEAVDLMSGRARQIAEWRRVNDLSNEGWPSDARPDMNTVTNATTPKQPGTGDWEYEGGALKAEPKAALPDGIIAVTTTRYLVGPYLYSTLDDALAQHRRQSRE